MPFTADDPRRRQIRFHMDDEVMTFGRGSEEVEVGLRIDLSSVDSNVLDAELDDGYAMVRYRAPIEVKRPCRRFVGPKANDFENAEETVQVLQERITEAEFRARFAEALQKFEEAYDQYVENELNPAGV